jgi:hypothetical protein
MRGLRRCDEECPVLITKLLAVGSDFGLIIEESSLELLDIEEATLLDVTTDGEALFIQPVRQSQ